MTNPCVRAQARQEKAYEKAKAGYLQAVLGGILKCRGEINQKLDRLMKTSRERNRPLRSRLGADFRLFTLRFFSDRSATKARLCPAFGANPTHLSALSLG